MHKLVTEALACEGRIKERSQGLEHEICSRYSWKQTGASSKSHITTLKALASQEYSGFLTRERRVNSGKVNSATCLLILPRLYSAASNLRDGVRVGLNLQR